MKLNRKSTLSKAFVAALTAILLFIIFTICLGRPGGWDYY